MIQVVRTDRYFVMLLLIAAMAAVYGLNWQPVFADAFYHYNAALQIASGNGFTDHYLWTYIGAPDHLPAPSHLYWMPGTSLLAALGMQIAGLNHQAAQIGFAICLWIAGITAYVLAQRLGLARWQMRLSAFSVICGGFFLPYWGQMDTFSPYAAAGGLALLCMGVAAGGQRRLILLWSAAGMLAGLGHLLRNDGLLLLLTGWTVLLLPIGQALPLRRRLLCAAVLTAAYLLVMAPWFWRNLQQIGSVLPAGGTQSAWFTEYDDLFNYPADSSMQAYFADGGVRFWQSRLDAIFGANGLILNFVAVEGAIVFAPFILIALWKRRGDALLRPVWIYALGLHVAFTLIFTYPGLRGGLFHGAAALVPIWAALGWAGIADVVKWAAARRRWQVRTALPVFSGGALLILVALSLSIALPRLRYTVPPVYAALQDVIPAGSVVMANDPAQLYYYTGLSGVALPNETPDVALEIARRYGVGYLLLQEGGITEPMMFSETPDFLQVIDLPLDGVRLYAFTPD